MTLRQLHALFGISKSAADRIINHLGPLLALRPRRRFRYDEKRRQEAAGLAAALAGRSGGRLTVEQAAVRHGQNYCVFLHVGAGLCGSPCTA